MLRWWTRASGSGRSFDALLSWIETTDRIMNTQHALSALAEWARGMHGGHLRLERLLKTSRLLPRAPRPRLQVGLHQHLRRPPPPPDSRRPDRLWVREFTLSGIARRLPQPPLLRHCRSADRFALVGQRQPSWARRRRGCPCAHCRQAPREVERLEIIGDGEVLATLSDLPAADETIGTCRPARGATRR